MVRDGGPEPTSIAQLAYKKRVDIFQVSLLNHVNLQTLTMIEDWTFQWQPSNIILIPACKSKNLEKWVVMLHRISGDWRTNAPLLFHLLELLNWCHLLKPKK
jgi:hypothetical protein